MSGFSEDVLAILKTNGVLQRDSAGLIMTATSTEAEQLYERLLDEGFVVASKRIKQVINYDYVVIPSGWNLEVLLYALSVVSIGGIIVMEISDMVFWSNRYVSRFGGFTGTKVRYGDNFYMVIHGGIDYGN